MARTSIIVAALFGVAIVIGCAIAVALWWSTKTRRPIDPRKLAETERTWLTIVALFLVALLFGTIWFTPYGGASGRAPQTMDVVAQQFAWTLDPPRVHAGEAVEFRLTAKDVNHGFGVYDDRHRLVFQVQVVPGKLQKVRHTFSRPGRYEVLCLEFCGVDHHLMSSTFEVTR